MEEQTSTIKQDCKLRVTTLNEALQKQGLFPEIILANIDEVFEALENHIELDREDIDQFVQQIEQTLQGQTPFIEKFRKCVYKLHDDIVTRNSLNLK